MVHRWGIGALVACVMATAASANVNQDSATACGEGVACTEGTSVAVMTAGINGSFDGSAAAFKPVPVPFSVMMLGTVIVGIVLVARRRQV